MLVSVRDITIIKSKYHFLLALSLGVTIIMSVVTLACNNVIAQTIETITKQRKAFENNPQIMVGSRANNPQIISGSGFTNNPRIIAVNDLTNKIYVTNRETGTVSVIDSNSGGSPKNIRVGEGPGFIAVDSSHNKIYVANEDSNTVSVIDGNKDIEIGQISVGESPQYILVQEFTGKIYVANSGNNTVSVIDTSTDKKQPHDIVVGERPTYMAAHQFLGKIYVANSGNNTVSVINTTNDKKEPHDIPVGDAPSSIALDNLDNKIYVANSGNNTVSVIDTSTDKKQPHDIVVGPSGYAPSSIAVDDAHQKIYVANTNQIGGNTANTVFVIDGKTDNKIKQISVGEFQYSQYEMPGLYVPADIAEGVGKIYVADGGGNTVSVINTTTDKKEPHDIVVGTRPSHLAINFGTGMIYVLNDIETVSVIDGFSDEVAAGVMLNTHPANSGTIMCDKKEYPTSIYLYVDAGTKCIAQPNKDFEFSGWVENLNGNSTIPLNTSANSTLSPSPLTSLLSTLGIIKPNDTSGTFDLGIIKPNDASATLTVNRYGTFTANFKPIPPAIPPDILVLLFGIILSSLFGWSIPSIAGWYKARKQLEHLEECINQIGKLDENAIENKIKGYYVQGKISEDHRQFLKDKISEYYEKVKDKPTSEGLSTND